MSCSTTYIIKSLKMQTLDSQKKAEKPSDHPVLQPNYTAEQLQELLKSQTSTPVLS